jgi:hypothetical protein
MNCKTCKVGLSKAGWYVTVGQMVRGPYVSQGVALEVASAVVVDLYRSGERTKLGIENAASAMIYHCVCADRKGLSCLDR